MLKQLEKVSMCGFLDFRKKRIVHFTPLSQSQVKNFETNDSGVTSYSFMSLVLTKGILLKVCYILR